MKKDSISLVINGDAWTRVDYFDNSSSSDKHFMLVYQSSGKCRIRFGDDITGAKPVINSVVYGMFAVTQGLLGRMDAGTITINTTPKAEVLINGKNFTGSIQKKKYLPGNISIKVTNPRDML